MRRDFLRQFELMGSPCAMFNAKERVAIVEQIRRCVQDGLLRSVNDKSGERSDIDWWIDTYILTDSGLVRCALKKPQQKEKGLFDD